MGARVLCLLSLSLSVLCIAPAALAGVVEICDDGIDNDQNGFTDCNDFACSDHPACQPNPELTLACPLGSSVSQPAAATTTLPGFSDESDNGLRSFDNFSGLDRPITGLVWWGGGTSNGPCLRDVDQFEVGFFQNNGSEPGDLVYSESFFPEALATGQEGGFGELLRYEVSFETPVDLASGWVSVFGIGDLSGCFYYWANGAGGNGSAYSSGFGNVAVDFAFCLVTAPSQHTADQNGDNVISLSELLRVIQFFNSGGLHCANPPESTEDGFAPNIVPNAQLCLPHASDYTPQNWMISLSELLRLIQFFNSGGYVLCDEGEDGFCPN